MSDNDLTPNQVRGYKATLSNPRVGEGAKESAKEILEQTTTPSTMSSTGPTAASSLRTDAPSSVEEITDQGGESNRVKGGYKATLKNPNVSDEAKEHAKEVLKDMGEEVRE